MKTYLFSFLLIIFSFSLLQAQGGLGINFETETWENVLKKAKEEDKLIFLDAYTTWCGPCEKMSKYVFTEAEVGAYYNENFINLKMDMEKGEGVKLARDYAIIAYPTFLFVDGNGKVLHRSAGYHDVEQFIALGTEALNPEGRLSSLEAKYQSGVYDTDFLKKYTKIRYDIADGSHGAIAHEYLKTQEDWSTEDNLQFIFFYTPDAKGAMFDYILENKEKFARLYGQAATSAKIQQLIYTSIEDTKEDSSLDQISRLFKKAYPQQAEQMIARFKMSFYRQAGDREKYMDAALDYYKKYPSEDQAELNETAWTFFRITKDKKKLKKALKFAKKSAKIDSNYYNNDTIASLYMALGKKRKARKAAQKAIQLAKEADIDYSPTEELLEQLEAQ